MNRPVGSYSRILEKPASYEPTGRLSLGFLRRLASMNRPVGSYSRILEKPASYEPTGRLIFGDFAKTGLL
jgi:hypothetical protein